MQPESGFLLIDKPADWTSHDVIAKLRRITGLRTIGHAGTLDPFATGLLIVGVGRQATKRLNEFLKQDKEYQATMVLGAISDTQDYTGHITATPGYDTALARWPTENDLRACFQQFTGTIRQIPPMYSAKKIAGKKLYELARQGKIIERLPVEVTVHKLTLTRYAPPEADFTVRCSSGTYVRTIAHDIGHCLNTGAYLKMLRRTKIDNRDVTNATTIHEVTPENWQKLLQN